MIEPYDYYPNTEEGARRLSGHILRNRLSINSYFRDREIRFDLKAAKFWFWPRVTWEEYNAATGNPGAVHLTEYPQGKPDFFNSNGKMIAATWSLPPGPVQFGGTCPTSAAYFHHTALEYLDDGRRALAVVPTRAIKAMQRAIALVSTPEQRKRRWVCNNCYAMKGQFVMPSKQLKWAALHRWVTEQSTSDFARNMIDMIRMNFDRVLWRVSRQPDSLVTQNPYYFRIHDAGDFYSKKYMHAWFEIASAIPQVQFWAATRTWMLPSLGREMQYAPSNMTIRPSEMFYDQPSRSASMSPSGVASSMVIEKDSKVPRGVYLCPVSHSNVNCQIMDGSYRSRDTSYMAIRPGCRACWDAPNLRIGYKEH